MQNLKFKIAIITVSDKGAAGQREDLSGPAIKEMLASLDAEIVAAEIIPDERILIAERLIHHADKACCDLILTTGGTGFSPRDVTPEATLEVIDRPVPGIPEAMRAASLGKTPMAMISRAAAGIRGRTLIINLPGSVKAVRENLEVILPVLPHAIEILRGAGGECGNQSNGKKRGILK
jgi:molybdenum cofactor synthesis domain-containing protein